LSGFRIGEPPPFLAPEVFGGIFPKVLKGGFRPDTPGPVGKFGGFNWKDIYIWGLVVTVQS